MSDASTSSSHMEHWMKPELFVDILSTTVVDFKQIKGFRAVPDSISNWKYAVEIQRLEFEIELVDGSETSHSLIIKICHDREVLNKLIKNVDFFAIETDLYINIIPELEEMYYFAGDSVTFGAKGYKIDAPVVYVLLEDLTLRGFKIVNRLDGLDMEHTKCALRKLAQWHAATAVRVALKGPYSETLNVGFFREENRNVIQNLHNCTSKEFLNCVSTYTGYEDYMVYMICLQPKLTDMIFRMAEIDPNDFNALNLSDCWTNNIMFQYDSDGKVEETYFINHQAPKYGSVAQDLYYLLLSSPKLELKLSKFDYFIKYYHDNLVRNLEVLKYNRPLPKLREIHAALFKYGFWGYSTATGILTTVLIDPMEHANEIVFSGDPEKRVIVNDMYTNVRYRSHIEAILPWLLHRGALSE